MATRGYRTQSTIGFVYFAAFPNKADVVKVGWSQCPALRVRELGTYSGARPKLLATIEIARTSPRFGTGSASLEYEIHRYLSPRRVDWRTMESTDRGEWYALFGEPLRDFVFRMCLAHAYDERGSVTMAKGMSLGPKSSSASNTAGAHE